MSEAATNRIDSLPTGPAPAAGARRLFAEIPRRRTWLPWRFLAGALLVHGFLLWLPFPEATPPLETSSVSVRLALDAPADQAETNPVPVPEAVPEIVPETVFEPIPEAMVPETAQAAEEPQTAPSPAGNAATASREPQPALKMEREKLLEAVRNMDWQRAPASRSLSRPTDGEVLERLYAPLAPLVHNSFDGMSAPSETQIVDRWQEPGGAHQVVIRGTDGETYCGRQEPMDDFRPWLQMPMLFHRCAGGGKRQSGSSWRNN